jgi:hypothetical protein
MKKLSLLLVLAVFLSTVLLAAIPTKMVRLTIINKSGADVMMQLTGSEITRAFYYLTVPAGTREAPTIKVFTIMSDVYDRTTWNNGLSNSGKLIADGNIRLTFIPVGRAVCSVTTLHIELAGCRGTPVLVVGANYQQGEPRMEKVSYFRYLEQGRTSQYDGALNLSRFSWYWGVRTYRLPQGVWFRYQY